LRLALAGSFGWLIEVVKVIRAVKELKRVEWSE
jgi:hypothetical protein